MIRSKFAKEYSDRQIPEEGRQRLKRCGNNNESGVISPSAMNVNNNTL